MAFQKRTQKPPGAVFPVGSAPPPRPPLPGPLGSPLPVPVNTRPFPGVTVPAATPGGRTVVVGSNLANVMVNPDTLPPAGGGTTGSISVVPTRSTLSSSQTAQTGGSSATSSTATPTFQLPPISLKLPFPTVKNMADWVRAKFQTMMGGLDGWPYNANLSSAAYFNVALQSTDQSQPAVPLPVQVAIRVSPSDSTSTGSASGSLTMTTEIATVSAIGAFYRTMSYGLEVDYSLPKSSTVFTQTFGPYSGEDISNQANPEVLLIEVNDFPATATVGITVDKSDGTPAGGVYVIASVTPASDPGYPILQQSGYTDGNGHVKLSSGVDINPTGSYVVSVNVLPAQNSTTILASKEWNTTGQALTAGTFAETITLPPSGQTANAGKIQLAFLLGSPATGVGAGAAYKYSVKNQNAVALIDGSGTANSEGTANPPPPTSGSYASTDSLTLSVSATYQSFSGSATSTITGQKFADEGFALNVTILTGSKPPTHGR